MGNILSWLIPIAAGALIGFVTNAVAIKMLFRPLKKWTLLGIPIPCTPGVLPRERKTLAVSIGRMVERELFTEEILRQRLEDEAVQTRLGEAVAGWTQRLLNCPLESLTGGWARVWSSPSAKADAEVEAEVEAGTGAGARTEACTGVSGLVDAVYLQGVDALVQVLNKEEILRKLVFYGRTFLSHSIQRMNVLQRLVISAGQFDKTLDEDMPAIIRDLLSQFDEFLHDPETRRRFTGYAGTAVLRELGKEHRTAGEFLSLDEEKKRRLDRFLTDRLIEFVRGQIGEILTTVNIGTMVRDRIDSLDMIRVERIILDVMGRQFWWINVFGAILGSLIGFVQVLLTRFNGHLF